MPGASDLHLVGVALGSLVKQIIHEAVRGPQLFFRNEKEGRIQVDVYDIAIHEPRQIDARLAALISHSELSSGRASFGEAHNPDVFKVKGPCQKASTLVYHF